MDYSSLVKNTNFDKVKDKNVIKKINDYNNALNGNKTSIYNSKVTAPLGKSSCSLAVEFTSTTATTLQFGNSLAMVACLRPI